MVTNGQATWDQINAQIDEILGEPGPRSHKYSGLPTACARAPKDTVTILPNGARQIKVHWPEEMS